MRNYSITETFYDGSVDCILIDTRPYEAPVVEVQRFYRKVVGGVDVMVKVSEDPTIITLYPTWKDGVEELAGGQLKEFSPDQVNAIVNATGSYLLEYNELVIDVKAEFLAQM